jgi:heme exporter protein B
MTAWGSFSTLVRFDFAREMARKGTLVAMGTTAVVTLFVFSFAIQMNVIPPGRPQASVLAGVLWVTWLLAGTVGIDRAFRGDGRVLEGLLLLPASRAALFYARTVSTFLFMLTIAAVSLPLFLIMFDAAVDAASAAWLAAVATLMLLGLAACGVLLSAMTWSLRGGDVLLRVLLLPMQIPAFAASVHGTTDVLSGRAPGVQAITMLLAFDLVFLGAGHFLFEHVVEDIGAQG